MSQPVKLASALPGGDRNGLAAIAGDLVHAPADQRLVLAVIDVKRIETNTDTDEVVPLVRVLRVESPLPMDRKEAYAMLRRATEARTSDDNATPPLPFPQTED